MQLCLTNNLKLVNKTQQLNQLNSLLRRQIGTNEVEKYASVVMGQCVRKTSGRKLVCTAMRHKVEDAQWCVGQARYEYFKSRKNMYCWMKQGSYIDLQFQRIMRKECEDLWRERGQHNKQKVRFLQQKRRSAEGVREPDIRGVKYRDEDIEAEFNDKNAEAVKFGGVTVSEDVKAAITLNPKHMEYDCVKKSKIQLAIEVGKTKARYSFMNW